jgi:hypothetical protein
MPYVIGCSEPVASDPTYVVAAASSVRGGRFTALLICQTGGRDSSASTRAIPRRRRPQVSHCPCLQHGSRQSNSQQAMSSGTSATHPFVVKFQSLRLIPVFLVRKSFISLPLRPSALGSNDSSSQPTMVQFDALARAWAHTICASNSSLCVITCAIPQSK